MRHGQRGQAIVEAAVFLPVLLLLLFGLIFFDRLGVVSERAESAVRYGDLVAFRHGQAYSASIVQDLVSQALYHNTPNQLLDLCLVPGNSASPTAGNVNAAMQAALTQSQVAPGTTGPAPAPSAKPFWRPDQTLSPLCAPGTVDLMQSPTGVGNLPLSVNNFSVTGAVDVPTVMQSFVGSRNANGVVVSDSSAKMAFINVATPSTLITCVPGLSIVLSLLNPSVTGALPCQ